MIKIVDNTAFVVIKKSMMTFKEGIRRGLLNVAPEMVREVRRLINSPIKTGRIYKIGGQLHQASAPGEAPATLTGKLAESVSFKVSSHTQLIIGDKANIAPYGKFLEGNFPNRIAPRPHLKPGALSKSRELGQALIRGVGREMKRTSK